MFENILFQYDESDVLYFVIYFLKKYNLIEFNYEIYDKKFIIIVRAFEKWRSKSKDFIYSIDIIINYKNLKYFMSIKRLNRRQICWNEFLFKFNYYITYRLNKVDDKLDALTRRSNDFFKEKNIENSRHRYQYQTILKFYVLNKKIKEKSILKSYFINFHCRIIIFDLIQLHFYFISFISFVILILINMKIIKLNVDDAKSQEIDFEKNSIDIFTQTL